MSITPQHSTNHAALQRVRVVGHLLDNAIPIPGTKIRVGLDPILGLLPGAGDWLSAVLSVYIVLESLRFKLPKKVLIQMVSNIVLDTVVGTVPVAGDMFDFAWKANRRNVEILEAHIQNPIPQRPANRWFVALVIVVLMIILIAIISIAVLVIRWLLGVLFR